MRELTIGGRRIADEEPAFVLAELGQNHNGSLETAIELIRMAAKMGASAIKLQKRDIETLYSREILDQPYLGDHSYGATYGQHRHALELSAVAFRSCAITACANQILWGATAFDEESADFLMDLGAPFIKIHSGGLTDRALIQHVARLDRPVILSTGGGTFDDIDRAIDWFDVAWSNYRIAAIPWQKRLALLHCTAAYPLKPEDANLRVILSLRERYPDTVIGWSSHHPGIALSLIAYAFGARIIEMHVTQDRAQRGGDHGFSLEPKGLQTLVEDLEKVRLALGDGVKRMLLSERAGIAKMRRVETPEGLRITR